MMNEKPKYQCTIPQTLVTIYHPEFRKGYQAGRQQYFRQRSLFTDKELVACLQSIFQEETSDKTEEPDSPIYYTIGYLLGQVSGHVVPRQPHEDNTQEVQKSFLDKITQMHGAAGKNLAETIDLLWFLQDKLAIKLDADIFEQMLNRGAETGAL